MTSSNKTFAKNTFFLYIMTGAKFVLPLIITACLTRRLGPDAYGVISYLTPVMGYFILLFDFGFNFSATKKIAQHRADPVLIEKTIAAVYTAKILLVLAGFLPLMLLLLCIDLLRQYVLLTVLYYLSTAAQIFIPDFLYRGLEKMEGVTTRYILAKLITAVLIFLAVRDDGGLILVPLAYLIGTVAAALHTNHHMVKKLGYRVALAGLREAAAELRESGIYFVSTFASTALSVTSTFVMGIVGMPTAQIAYWGVAFQVVQAVQAMYDPITTSIYPHVAGKRDHKFVLRITLCLLPLVAAGCVLLYCLAGLAVKIIAGSAYLAAVPVLQALTPMLLFSFVAQMLGFPLLGALGRERQASFTTLVAAGAQILGLVGLALSHHFTLLSLAQLRNVTELIFMILRIYFVGVFLRERRKSRR
jgi:PST family polysaccharide transporter|nr:oligosaccharide flippase family protein [uncultured Oscillibacter sp.]